MFENSLDYYLKPLILKKLNVILKNVFLVKCKKYFY